MHARDFRVVLTEPRYEGNVGAAARLLRNFGLDDLFLVRPPPLGDEALRLSMQGAEVLRRARVEETLEGALAETDWVVGTTGVATSVERRFLRQAISPRQLAERLAEVEGRVALVFGREDFGLLNKELGRCDLLVTVPTDPTYPILNLSHAVAIVLYELHQAPPATRIRKANGEEKEVLHRAFDDLLDATAYPAHKRERTRTMFRRLVGRALPSKWEFHAFMGVLRRASKTVRRLSESQGRDPSS